MFVELIGRAIAATPESFVRGLCVFVGQLMYWSPKSGRVRRNLRRAFPEIEKKQLEELIRLNCQQTVELGLMGLASPSFSNKRWRGIIDIPDAVRAKIEKLQQQPRGVLFLTPHTILMEAITAMPHFFDKLKPISVLYRAFKDNSLQAAMLKSRQRAGMRLLNRSTGLYQLIRALRRGENGGMLFDQKSGQMGVLFEFMGRAATASDLPDILYRRGDSPIPIYLAIKRTGFWRGQIVLEELSEEGAGEYGLTLAAHRELEKHLNNSESRIDWLWAHDRWNTLRATRRRLGFNHRCMVEVPRTPRFNVLVRLPADLDVARAILPMVAVIAKSRTDAAITVACRSQLIDKVHQMGFAKRVVGYPKGFLKRLNFFRSLRECDFEIALGCEGSFGEQFELMASGADDTYSWAAPQSWRPFIIWHHLQRFKQGNHVENIAKMLKKMGIYGLSHDIVEAACADYQKFFAAKQPKSC